MKAPEKIYLQVCGDCKDNDCKNCKFEDLEDNVTWCKDEIFDKDIEYIRTDAFIEKAVLYLIHNTSVVHYPFGDIREFKNNFDEMLKDFRNYIKRE